MSWWSRLSAWFDDDGFGRAVRRGARHFGTISRRAIREMDEDGDRHRWVKRRGRWHRQEYRRRRSDDDDWF